MISLKINVQIRSLVSAPISTAYSNTPIHSISSYRPQRSCEGYVFTRVCLSTGGGEYLGRYPSRTRHTPLWTRYTPRNKVPPGPCTPPGPGTPPRRRLLLRTVWILLECILVLSLSPTSGIEMNRTAITLLLTCLEIVLL